MGKGYPGVLPKISGIQVLRDPCSTPSPMLATSWKIVRISWKSKDTLEKVEAVHGISKIA